MHPVSLFNGMRMFISVLVVNQYGFLMARTDIYRTSRYNVIMHTINCWNQIKKSTQKWHKKLVKGSQIRYQKCTLNMPREKIHYQWAKIKFGMLDISCNELSQLSLHSRRKGLSNCDIGWQNNLIIFIHLMVEFIMQGFSTLAVKATTLIKLPCLTF